MYPSAAQVGPAVGTEFHGMLHPPGRSHALTGEAVTPWFSGFLFLWGLLAGGRLIPRHPKGTRALQMGFQGPNQQLQLGNDHLLLGNQCQQSFPTRQFQVQLGVHIPGMPQLRPAMPAIFRRL